MQPSMCFNDPRSSLDVFGVDSQEMGRVLNECMSRGADFADLFFSASNCDFNVLEAVSSVGLIVALTGV